MIVNVLYVRDFENVEGRLIFFVTKLVTLAASRLLRRILINLQLYPTIMYKTLISLAAILLLLTSCARKEVKQGMISYTIGYQLPDSLRSYEAYLPKTAIVYFKGDSTVSIQQAGPEATTVITHKPTDLVRVLLSSSAKKYVMDYPKNIQAELLPASTGYAYAATKDTMTMAGHKTKKYELTDKATGVTSEAWFTKEIRVVPNYLTMVFDTAYGVPLAFTTKQNGMPVTTKIKEIKFEPVPAGVFSTPTGYQKISPEQFKNLQPEN